MKYSGKGLSIPEEMGISGEGFRHSWLANSRVIPYNKIRWIKEMLKEKLSEYLKNPIVTIQFQNFKVTILGEVKAPGSYKVVSERVSLLDALGMAGDLQINGKRKNVLVMREQGDEKIFARVDLTSSDFIDSPFFYLQQNDVVYVEPNKGRIAGGSVSTFLPYILSSLSTIVALISLTR